MEAVGYVAELQPAFVKTGGEALATVVQDIRREVGKHFQVSGGP